MNLVMSSVDRAVAELLIRLDAVTVVLMFGISVAFIYQTVAAWLDRRDMRPLMLMMFFAALTGWVAMELFQIMMSRAAALHGEATSAFMTSRGRLTSPGIGILIALFITLWLSWPRFLIIGLAMTVSVWLMIWPEPMVWFALVAYRWLH
jgi:hypothetical protein